VLTPGARRGFTLVEILISLVLVSLVTGAIYQVLVSNQRLSRAQAERVDLQTTVRTGALVVGSELREVNIGAAPRGDIYAPLTPTGIRYRAMRGVGLVCQVVAPNQFKLGGMTGGTVLGYRAPSTNDSLFVFWEGTDLDVGTEDEWVGFKISAVTAGVCGVNPAVVLTVNNDAAGAAAFAKVQTPPPGYPAGVPANTPARIWEAMELASYLAPADGKWWLGIRSISAGEALQPVLGPLVDANGLRLQYLDVNGAVTADVSKVRSIGVELRGVTSQAISRSGSS
jgi:prepilin-type N-terminal cleavage/methylation domain-containing protein